MSLLQAFIDRFLGRTNPTPQVVLAVSDDGTADPVAAGKLSPFRADPTTGAILTRVASGASGGTVAQGTGSAASPWGVQGVNGGALERLAAYAQLPSALVGGRLDANIGAWLGSTVPTVGRKSEANSIPVVLSNPGSTGPTPLSPKTVPTVTAEAVAASTPVTKFVRVTSDFANTKTIYVSGSTVTVANGQPLGPGDSYAYTDVNDAALIYCISADAAQVLRVEVL